MNSTAVRAEAQSANNTHMVFYNEKLEKFYYEKLEQARYQDCYHKALIYILGISEDTRNYFSQIYDIQSGYIPTGIGSQAIVQVALTQEGNSGNTYWSWYGFDSRVEWCACFVSWCAEQCGYLESGVIPKFSLCSDGVDWFNANGQFKDASYVSAAGDIIFFDWGNDGTIDHVGIVESVTNGVVNTVEDNSGDKVARRSYNMGSNSIYGYGVVLY